MRDITYEGPSIDARDPDFRNLRSQGRLRQALDAYRYKYDDSSRAHLSPDSLLMPGEIQPRDIIRDEYLEPDIRDYSHLSIDPDKLLQYQGPNKPLGPNDLWNQLKYLQEKIIWDIEMERLRRLDYLQAQRMPIR